MTLLIGYGNPGRGDDGIGPAFAHWAEAQALPGLTVISDFQLKVEHAIQISEASQVIFVDACIGADRPVTLEPLAPSPSARIDSHSLHPSTVLGLTQLLFDATPPAFILAIAGTSFEMLHDGLSDTAQRNIDIAQTHFLRWFHDAQVTERPTPVEKGSFPAPG
ncbi:hydrogenase maturation protease [Marivita hallyeonensis]|uniref:Hydrogenase maturation protease n=1 Tax=Marivita hallyeonensis TaxID=996342 RepID=A0A1M5WH05_9RHOB|nr:hydrogenase maturation protease [Marivita hallyeonensis]SHH86648.1 hydrogenase maturation protease [Marivita hallyeonensis]